MGKTLILMQGIPGSGKSTLAHELAHLSGAIVLSTDDFWYRDVEHDRVYDFRPDDLATAHRWNQQRAIKAMQSGKTIIIDNTNIRLDHVKPYMMMADIFEYEIQVVRIACSLETALSRNEQRSEDRRIPPSVILRMYNQMENLV